MIEMRNKSICKAIKVDTADNPSDFGTKTLNTAEFKRQRRYFLRTPRYSRSKTVRGDLAKMQNVQVGSVTSALPIWMLSASHWALCSCGLDMELQCEVLRINYRRGMHIKAKIS